MAMHSIADSKKEKVKEKITYLLKRREEVVFSYIHGSFTEGDFRDIDIAVYLRDEEKALPYELTMGRRIEDAIGFPADVVAQIHSQVLTYYASDATGSK